MAHCPFDRLRDLDPVFRKIRTWADIREPRPGVFYVRRTAFLHFHIDKEDHRWADARAGAEWGPPVDIPIGHSSAVRSRFLREVRRRYEATRA